MRRRHTPRTGWNDLDPQETATTPERIEEQIREATKEIQEKVGISGSLKELRLGGMRIAPGLGVGAYSGGLMKSTIKPNGDAFFGSGIEEPAGTSYAIFANEQIYNGELMEAGDILVGDNSDGVSNIKWDASEGQWQFRMGTTVRTYMDTDGTLKAGGGAITLDEDGQSINDGGDAITFFDTTHNAAGIIALKPIFDGGSTILRQLLYVLDSETNQISNGDFETGDFTSWAETDPSSVISVVSGEGVDGGHAFQSLANSSTGYIQQNLAATATKGMIVRMRVKSPSGGVIALYNGTTTVRIQLFESDVYRNYYEIVYSSSSYLRVTPAVTGTIYIDDIVVQKLKTNSSVPQASYVNISEFTVDALADTVNLYPGWGTIPYTFGQQAYLSGALSFYSTGVISPASLSADQNNYTPTGLGRAGILRLTSSVDVNITGLSNAGTWSTVVFIWNIGSNVITLVNNSGSSSAGNRFALNADIALAPNQGVMLIYDSTLSRWLQVGSSLSTEAMQDLIGAMVTGNTETGIAVAYDDTNGKLNFDAQTAGDARYAPIAKGVTNGDSHDHVGGDGAQVNFLNLSNLPTSVTNTNDIFNVGNPGGVSEFTGTINGAPSGASVAYNVSSGQEGAMVPTSTSQLGKMRLYNTTRGNSALILNCDVGTNTITLTANAPANWVSGDTITIVSQTVSGGGGNWVDIEITSGPTGKTALFVNCTYGTGTTGDNLVIHPFEAFASSKFFVLPNLSTTVQNRGFGLIKIVTNVFSISWAGNPTNVIIREAGYLQ